MKKMMFFLAIAMVFTMASCSKDDDPTPSAPAEDSIYVCVNYTINANFSPYTEQNNGCGVVFYDSYGNVIDGGTLTPGVPLVIKGTRLFLILRDATIMKVSATTTLYCDHHLTSPSPEDYSPANPGDIAVKKNMVVRWTPTITFTRWW